jgi:hypothetical protein
MRGLWQCSIGVCLRARVCWTNRHDDIHSGRGVGSANGTAGAWLQVRLSLPCGEVAQTADRFAKSSASHQKERNTLIAITLMMSTKKAETNGKMMKAFGEGP